jgi:hypothetical protein
VPRPRAIATTASTTSRSVGLSFRPRTNSAVDLEHVEAQILEVVERREARAEVVERQQAARPAP